MHLRVYAVAGGIFLLCLAAWLLADRRSSAAESLGPQDLFVRVDPGAQDLLLEDWRWKVGPDARVFRATVFGDLFTQDSQGSIHWLDTGSGRYVEVARSVEEWKAAGPARWQEWMHWSVLQDLRSRGVQLKEGQVFSWRQDPMVGGAESVENVDFVPLSVHVSHAGRLAKAVRDLPPGAKIDKLDFEVQGHRGTGMPRARRSTRSSSTTSCSTPYGRPAIRSRAAGRVWASAGRSRTVWTTSRKSGPICGRSACARSRARSDRASQC